MKYQINAVRDTHADKFAFVAFNPSQARMIIRNLAKMGLGYVVRKNGQIVASQAVYQH